jgi:hypothetical protein
MSTLERFNLGKKKIEHLKHDIEKLSSDFMESTSVMDELMKLCRNGE